MATEFGLQYWIAGRYAVASHLSPTAGNHLHHAVEFLLKAAIARKGVEVPIGRRLRKIYRDFRALYSDPALDALIPTLRALDRFEDIRYPDTLLKRGGMLQVAFEPGQFSSRVGGTMQQVPSYQVAVHDVDAVVLALMACLHWNPVIWAQMLGQEHAKLYHLHRNPKPLKTN